MLGRGGGGCRFLVSSAVLVTFELLSAVAVSLNKVSPATFNLFLVCGNEAVGSGPSELRGAWEGGKSGGPWGPPSSWLSSMGSRGFGDSLIEMFSLNH